MPNRLTDKSVDQARPGATRQEIADALLPGLYLVVQPSGSKSWAVRYRAVGRPAKHTLGAYPAIKLGAARKLGEAALRRVAEGADPAGDRREAKRRQRAGIEGRDLVETTFAEYSRRRLAGLKLSTIQECEAIFRREILPAWGKRQLDELGKRDALDLLDDIVDRGKPLVANKVLQQLRTFFNWTVDRGIIGASPVAGIRKPAAEVSRERVLSDDELRWLWLACDVVGDPFGPIVRLLLLTGARREEVRAMSEREVANELWTIPAARTKNGRAHGIHLSAPARAVLAGVIRTKNEAGYLFSTNGKTAPSGFSRAKRNLDKAMVALAAREAEERGSDPLALADWRLHDLRRTAASGMARMGIPLPVIERCLNHVSGSFAGIVGVYQRHEYAAEKQAAFDTWGRHVSSLVERQSAFNVVPLKNVVSR